MKKVVCVLGLVFLTAYNHCALDMQKQSCRMLHDDICYTVYVSQEFPAIAHVVKIPYDKVSLALVPARGQRQPVSKIAQETKALVAINGSNYRRGGQYNGNRVNLLYLQQQLYSDVQLKRGSFAWKNDSHSAAIASIGAEITLSVKDIKLPVTAVNQPRLPGQAVIYTDSADVALLAHTDGVIIAIDNNRQVISIDTKIPDYIPSGHLLYQVDTCPDGVTLGSHVTYSYALVSGEGLAYNQYDFVLGGAGLLIEDGVLTTDQLYEEFSQGSAIVHCNDEVVADFYTRKEQEWLIALRHPRTAVGITDDNEICIVVVDGRQKQSEGFTLKELACFMQQLGCKDALNIGGGGCSTLCINGEVCNTPSGSFERPGVLGERPVTEALCFWTK